MELRRRFSNASLDDAPSLSSTLPSTPIDDVSAPSLPNLKDLGELQFDGLHFDSSKF